MRVSQHSGRTGSARHNDRSFLDGKTPEERAEMAPHIRADAKGNRVWRRVHDHSMTLQEEELACYRSWYAAGLEARNGRYRKEGHPDRCRTVEQLYEDSRTRPEEVILQIGSSAGTVSPDTLASCFGDYLKQLQEWSRSHGNCMHILDAALHTDETTPHIHLRRCWDYTDRFGNRQLGQNQALKVAGVGLPDPGKPEGRYNNRKMAFDSWARGRWQEICRQHGLEIETEPVKGRRHKSTKDYVYDSQRAEYERLQADIVNSRQEAAQARQEAAQARQEADAMERITDAARQEYVQMLSGDLGPYMRSAERQAALERVRQYHPEEFQGDRYQGPVRQRQPQQERGHWGR